MKKNLVSSASLLAAYCLTIVLPGCGGGSSGTGIFTTGVSRTRQINSLSAQEVAAVCKRLDDYVAETLTRETVCNLTGIVLQDLVREFDELNPSLPDDRVLACEQLKNECLNPHNDDDEDEESDDSIIDCGLGTEVTANLQCLTIIKEYEDCQNAIIDGLQAEFGEATCKLVSDENQLRDIAIQLQNISNTPACQTAKAKCPGLFDE